MRKRTDLLSVIDSALSPLFLGQLKNLAKAALLAFKKEMLEGMKGQSYNFAEIVASAKGRCEKRFMGGAKEAKLEDTDWVWEDELELLREEIKLVADQCRADETKKMVNQIEVRKDHFWPVARSRLKLFYRNGSVHSKNKSPSPLNCL